MTKHFEFPNVHYKFHVCGYVHGNCENVCITLQTYLNLHTYSRRVCVYVCVCVCVCAHMQATVNARVLCFSVCQFHIALYD